MNASTAAILFWISVALCAIAELAIVAATARASRRSVTSDPSTPLDLPSVDDPRPLPRPRRWLELLYVATPAIALVVLFLYSWRALPPAR